MKRIGVCLSLLVLSLLISCGKKGVIVPKGLNYNQETKMLTWNKIESAQSYIVEINGEAITTEENEFSFFNYKTGQYRVKIKAILTKGTSIYSNPLIFVVKEELDLFYYADKDYLYWEAVEDAQYYITIDEGYRKDKVKIDDTSFKLTNYLKSKETAMILDVYKDGLLIYNKTLILNYNITNVLQEQDYHISVSNPQRVYINGLLIESGIILKTNEVILSKELIEDYINNDFYLCIEAEHNLFMNIEVILESFNLLTYYKQPYNGEDIHYEFELKGYTLKKIKNLTAGVDYLLEGETLIIKKEYIQGVIDESPTKISIELELIFEKAGQEKIGRLEIDLIA